MLIGIHGIVFNVYHSLRMTITDMLICLIMLTSQCVCVHSKVIIVNSNNGNDNTECCVNGECACSSLSTALLNIDNNTIINITSQSVALNNTTTMGSGKLTNITITGSNVTIMCNNSGSIYCESCDDVMIEGITWDRCGDPNGTNIAGVTFNGTSNISLVNCTFQHSQSPAAVALLQVSDIILIQTCNFSSNFPLETDNSGVLNISTVLSHGLSSTSSIIVTINEGYFYNNTYNGIPPVNIHIDDNSVANCNITFKKSTFISNEIIFFLHVKIQKSINILLTEISVFNNSHYFGTGAIIHLLSITDDVVLLIISSNFHANKGSNLWCEICGHKITVAINSSRFSDKSPALLTETLIPTVYISSTAKTMSEIMFNSVHFNNNVIAIPTAEANVDTTGNVAIFFSKGNVIVYMSLVNFTFNQYFGQDRGALAISLPYENGTYHKILITGCNFVSNKSPGHGAALYIDTKNKNDNIQIINTVFDHNIAGYSVVYLQGFWHPVRQTSPINFDQPVIINTLTFTNNVGSAIYLSSCDVKLKGISLFKNNIAENGGALYVEKETNVNIDDKAAVKFIANTANLNGGAIYVDLYCSHDKFRYYQTLNTFRGGSNNATHRENVMVRRINSGLPPFIGYAVLLRNVTEFIGERSTGGVRYNRVT